MRRFRRGGSITKNPLTPPAPAPRTTKQDDDDDKSDVNDGDINDDDDDDDDDDARDKHEQYLGPEVKVLLPRAAQKEE